MINEVEVTGFEPQRAVLMCGGLNFDKKKRKQYFFFRKNKHQALGWGIRTNLILSALNIKEMQGSCSNIQLSINLTFNIDVEMFICAKWIFHNFRHFDPGIQKNVHNKLINVAQHVLEKNKKEMCET